MYRMVLLSLALLSCRSAAATAQTLPTARPENVGMSRTALDSIAPAMQSYIDSGRVAGMVIAISRRGQLVYERALGYADLEKRTPMRTDAVFQLASARKPLLAAATMLLVDAGRIRLDDPVSRYIPSFGAARLYVRGGSHAPIVQQPAIPITIRHLLTHTSGLATGYFDHPVDSIYNRVLRESDYSLTDYADKLAAIPLEFSPGTAWRYSRSLEVIGRVMEVASSDSLEQFLRTRLFVPLGMSGTWFSVTPEIASRIPTRYNRTPDGKLTVVASLGRSEPLPTGTMLSTVRDYIRFGHMLLNRGTVDGKRVLSPESVDELLRNQVPHLTPISTPLWDHQGYGFGLGGGVRVAPATETAPAPPGTYRWPGSSGTFFWVDPANDLVAVVFTQSNVGYSLEHHFQRLVYAAIN
jgi:CubicO group peptidase (beta-lactamase class C family)